MLWDFSFYGYLNGKNPTFIFLLVNIYNVLALKSLDVEDLAELSSTNHFLNISDSRNFWH